MEYKIKSITENYRERIQRLALFDCLYRLDKKRPKDNSGKVIDLFSLGLLALLFFFENMLMRNKKTGVRQLAGFFSDINEGEIDLDLKGFEIVARTVIDSFRPPGGKRNFIQFYNWETRQEETIEYSILKASKSDIKANTQYYTLDDQGLELVFATKEYFSEFQLSISQLLLRKQLEKGEFVGALRQIDEMRIDVENLEERMIKIKYEIQRNILSEKTYERYKNLVEDINIRLKRENEEFDELKDFTDQTRETLAYDIKDEKDVKAYEYIVKIQKELGKVHRLHRNLLQKSIELKNTTLQSAREALYYIGIDSFNFKQEIVSGLFATPLPLQSSKTLIKPFLYPERSITWSPITVFDRQRITGRDEEDKADEFLTMKDEDILKEELEI
ncbi:MAG TPA: replicative DNA helicase, partial [Oscillospiraceae bacterium]|nr:replicative DNA helicase [Oscillospiraceae bacterium]